MSPRTARVSVGGIGQPSGPPARDPLMSVSGVIETDRLTKRYGAVRGIEDVSISVESGEIYGFLGPNGAGKTTTIRTLLDLLHPTSGRALIFGLDSRRASRDIRARLGNLPGDFTCDTRVTGRRFLEFCADARGIRGIGSAWVLAQRFEADLDRRSGDLSRGNRQKIGLIQALFHDPELLMFDEPTTGLDPLMQEEFLSLLSSRPGSPGCGRWHCSSAASRRSRPGHCTARGPSAAFQSVCSSACMPSTLLAASRMPWSRFTGFPRSAITARRCATASTRCRRLGSRRLGQSCRPRRVSVRAPRCAPLAASPLADPVHSRA